METLCQFQLISGPRLAGPFAESHQLSESGSYGTVDTDCPPPLPSPTCRTGGGCGRRTARQVRLQMPLRGVIRVQWRSPRICPGDTVLLDTILTACDLQCRRKSTTFHLHEAASTHLSSLQRYAAHSRSCSMTILRRGRLWCVRRLKVSDHFAANHLRYRRRPSERSKRELLPSHTPLLRRSVRRSTRLPARLNMARPPARLRPTRKPNLETRPRRRVLDAQRRAREDSRQRCGLSNAVRSTRECIVWPHSCLSLIRRCRPSPQGNILLRAFS